MSTQINGAIPGIHIIYQRLCWHFLHEGWGWVPIKISPATRFALRRTTSSGKASSATQNCCTTCFVQLGKLRKPSVLHRFPSWCVHAGVKSALHSRHFLELCHPPYIQSLSSLQCPFLSTVPLFALCAFNPWRRQTLTNRYKVEEAAVLRFLHFTPGPCSKLVSVSK